MSRSKTYLELAAKNLRAVKVGRSIRIDVRHGLAFMASLPEAEIGAIKRNA